MKVLGIVAEYNPFTPGHLYHLNEAKRLAQPTHVVCVMSSNFVQRGEPAITDKFTRAKSAVEMGVDLVLELPFLFSTSSSEYFSLGALQILKRTGFVTDLSFGSETGDLEALHKELNRQESLKRSGAFKRNLKSGKSYQTSLEATRKPNDILALGYLKAMERLDFHPSLHVIKRKGSYHDERLTEYPSATALRASIKRGELPFTNPLFIDSMEDMIFKYLLTEDLTDTLGMKEGIEHALKKAANHTRSLEELLSEVQNVRFKRARLKRLLLHGLLNVKEADRVLYQTSYLRPLAFNEKGRELLRLLPDKIQKITWLPEDPLERRLLELEIRASNLYYYLQKTPSEYTRVPYVVRRDQSTDL
ncbi:tRNA(Met) cytidine acetate ligase [Guggenheimella bovis]